MDFVNCKPGSAYLLTRTELIVLTYLHRLCQLCLLTQTLSIVLTYTDFVNCAYLLTQTVLNVNTRKVCKVSVISRVKHILYQQIKHRSRVCLHCFN